MCLYEKENPLYLKECLKSINNLSIYPNELIIVKDGPLTDELDKVIESHDFPEDIQLKIVALPENVTLGPARAEGVKKAENDWVAIMDSDDICKPDRFEKQISLIENNTKLGLIGGQIAEFIDIPEQVKTARVVPTENEDIVRFAKTRSPFNHMTVMFKRDEVLKAGNYRFFPLFEDYDLWTRMIKNGTICANHCDVLVDARISRDTYNRRRGIGYIGSEWRMQKQLKKLGLINTVEFIRNVSIRIPVRLLPGSMLSGIYKMFTRKSVKGRNR